ncbi:MAG TPA: 2Fe-2S iron-sulfur cluster-binding protein [Candidatus Thermoplasmatota archaeon]|nr:2Fe-2S iron-sulfur cluster-binding protein [Candidatus Thermoplasmatota archaeon]
MAAGEERGADAGARPRGLRVSPGPAAARGKPITLRFGSRSIPAFEGETVGAALHAAGERVLMRSIKYHRPRGLFCNAGKCASCLMRIDGVPNVRACVTPARDGMKVESQNAFPSARRDFLGIVDKVYRRNLDLHERFTRPRPLAMAFNAIARRMAGFGRIPDLRPLRRPSIGKREVDVLVVGGGPSGLSAAAAAAGEGASVLLVDESDRLGGTLLLHPEGAARADALAQRLRAAGGEALPRTTAFGVYLTDGHGDALEAPGVVAIMTPERVVEVRAKALVVASGYHEAPPLVPGNDLPGVMGTRAALVLLHRHGILPGTRVAFAGDSPLAARAREDLAKAGCELVEGPVTEVWGGRHVEGAVVGGAKTELDCVLAGGDETPRIELLQQAGATMALASFAVVPQALPARVLAAGSVTDVRMPLEARLASGARAGEAAARLAKGAGA